MKPRLCFAIWSFGVGGAERFLIALLKSIPRERYDVHVLCLKQKGIYAHELEDAGIAVDCIDKRHKFDPGTFVRLLRYLWRVRPDLLNTHLWTADFWGRIAGLLCGIPHLVVTEQNVDVWKSPTRRAIDRFLFRFTDAAICVGDEVRAFYVRDIGFPADRTVVIPNAIDLDRYAGAPIPRPDLAVGADDFVFVCAARLHPQKAHRVLVEAARLLVDRGVPAFRVLLIGDGTERPSIEAHVRRSGLGAIVTLLGARTDVPAILATADAFVLSSDYEGTSLAILEAMAASLPVVATDVGANRAVVGDGAGLIVAPQDPARLADAMERLMRDRPAARAMGGRGREIVRATYGIDVAARATLELFDRLLAGERAGAS